MPHIRRVYVPAGRPEVWPKGDWQPLPFAEFEELLAAARRATLPHPGVFLEKADYEATLVDGLIHDARLEWTIRRPDAAPRLLFVGGLNLNLSDLAWSDPQTTASAAIWGTRPDGSSVILVDRSGRLVGRWDFTGRRLAGSTEFDFELVPAVISRLKLKVPAGLIVSSTTGDLTGPTALEPGWSEWRLNLGSRATCRLRIAPPVAAGSANPLVVAKSHLSYVVRAEAIRMNADFEFDVLESSLRELRLAVDPDVQVTSIEYGDDGFVAWESTPGSQGREIIAKFPDALSGEGHTLQVQAIAQARRQAPWPLPRVRVEGAVDVSGKVTLRVQPPFQAADIRPEGYRQLELTAGEAEGEVHVFRQTRSGGSIVVVPADAKAELVCRATTLIEPDRNQWAAISELEWEAAAGSAFAASCLVAAEWEIVDVRLAAGEGAGAALAWQLDDRDPGRRILQIDFPNAVRAQKPQRVRITARRPAPPTGQRASVPPLAPLDTVEVDHVLVASAAAEQLPAFDATAGMARIAVGEIPPARARLDFLASRLSDRRARVIAMRTGGASATAMLKIDSAPGAGQAGLGEHSPSPENPSATVAELSEELPEDPSTLPASLRLVVHVSGIDSGFDHCVATFRLLGPRADQLPFRWTLPAPAELVGVSVSDRPVAPVVADGRYVISSLPVERGEDRPQPPSVKIEYRVPVRMHRGANSRPLVVPEPDRPVLGTHLDLVLAHEIRLSGSPRADSLRGLDERSSWQRRLLGRFSRPEGAPLFNPFVKRTWSALFSADPGAPAAQATVQVWRGIAPDLPLGARYVVWNAAESDWLSLGLVLAALVAGLATRMARLPGRQIVASLCLAGLFFAGLALPPVESELAGSALFGVVLAVLTPQRLLIIRRASADLSAVPAGSTQSFVVSTALLVMILATSGFVANAQTDGARPQSDVLPFDDILVPLDPDRTEPGKGAVGYASSELLSRLKRIAAGDAVPAYLIGAASFDGTVSEGDRFSVVARLPVHVMARGAKVRVMLPLGLVNLGGIDACRVDGKSQPVVADPDGKGLIIELTGPGGKEPGGKEGSGPEGGGAATEIEPPPMPGESNAKGERAQTDVATHVVELRLAPAVNSGRNEVFSARVAIPPGCGTHASLASQADLALLRLSARGTGPTASSSLSGRSGSRRVEIRPALAREVAFSWSAREQAPGPAPVGADVGVSCLAELLAGSLELKYHFTYRVSSGQLDSVRWQVPAGYSVRSIQGPQLAGYRFDRPENGSRKLLIEFATPQEGELALSASFVLPAAANGNQIALPLVEPLRDQAGAGKIGLRFYQLAIKQPFDVRLAVASAVAEQPLRPKAVDDFLREWDIPGGRPQQAFELDRSFAVNLTLDSASAPPAVRASSIGRVHPGRLDWTYTAEVEHVGAPLFVYRLHVDPRLRVRSVSVEEDGADRLLRWSQSRDDLVLFLNDRAARSQTVRVGATMAVAAAEELEIPRIRFAEAVPATERVAVYEDENVVVRLVNPEDFPLTGPGPQSPDARGDTLVARLEVLAEQSHPRLSIEPVVPDVSAVTATVVESQSGNFAVSVAARFRISSGRLSQFIVELPERLAAAGHIRSLPESRFETEPPVDGRVRVTFRPESPVATEFIAIAASEDEAPAGAWRAPEVRTPGVNQSAAYLVAVQGAVEFAAADPAPQPAELPDWLNEAVAGLRSVRHVYLWNGAAPTVELRSVQAARGAGSTEIARVDLWPTGNGKVRGWLGLAIPEGPPRTFELDWPLGAKPEALFIGDRFRAPPEPQEGRCTIPLDESRPGLAWICWTADDGSRPTISAPLSTHVPWPHNLVVRECRINVHAPPGFRIEADPALAASEASASDQLVPTVLAQVLNEDRFRTADISTLLAPAPDSGGEFVLPAGIRITQRRWIQLALLVVGAGGVALVAWKSTPVFHWLSAHDLGAWLTLAVFSWLFLEPNWLGPALMLATCLIALFHRLHRPSSRGTGFQPAAPEPLA